MREAFVEDPFNAYEKFVKKRWKGKHVGIYITELSRMADIAGIKGETLLKRAFIIELPVEVGKELRTLKNLSKITIEDLVSKARTLLSIEKIFRLHLSTRSLEI